MRPLHEVARNTRAGHFVWPGGGRSINLTSIEILPSSKSLTAPIPAHAPTSLPFLPAVPPLVHLLRISLYLSHLLLLLHISFFLPFFRRAFASTPSTSFFILLPLIRRTTLSLASFPYSLPWFLYLSCSLAFFLFLFLLFPFPLFSLSNLSRDPRKTRMTGRERGK